MALGFLIRGSVRPWRITAGSTLGGASPGLVLSLGLVSGGPRARPHRACTGSWGRSGRSMASGERTTHERFSLPLR